MPYALVIVGLLMIITGINNTYAQFASQLQKDSAGFIYYFIALFAVGALGYIDDLKQFSHYFMALILVALVLSNKGVFAQFQAALKAGPTAPTASAQSGGTSAPVTASSSTSTINSAITSNQQGVGGSTPATTGQAKFNGWMNYFFGTGTVTQ